MSPINRSIPVLRILRALAHAPGYESYGERIAQETGLHSATVYGAIGRLVNRGILRRGRETPGKHGTPRRYVQLTDAGRDLATRWGVMKREHLAAQRLRAIAAALDLPANDPLCRTADLLEKPDPTESTLDLTAVVAAVIGDVTPQLGGHGRAATRTHPQPDTRAAGAPDEPAPP